MKLGSIWCLHTGAEIVILVGRLLNVSIKDKPGNGKGNHVKWVQTPGRNPVLRRRGRLVAAWDGRTPPVIRDKGSGGDGTRNFILELLLAVDGKFDTKFLNTHLAHCSSLAHCRGCRAASKGCTVRCSHQVNLCGTRAEPWRAFGCVHTAGFILLAVLWQTLYM